MRLLHVTSCLPGRESLQFVPEEALYRGKWVHLACHWHDQGKLDPNTSLVAPQWWGYVRAWEAAKIALGIVVLASEEPVKDERRGYCGTRDKRVLIHHRRGEGIIDLKCDASGSGKIPDTTGLQVAGYVGEEKLWRGAVALHPDGSYHYHDDKTSKEIFRPGDWREFCSRLHVFQCDISRGWRELPAERGD